MTHNHNKDTTIVNAGRHPERHHGAVNPPVYHASTILFPTVAALEASYSDPFTTMRYGRHGTPTTQAIEEAVAAIEGGYRTVAVSSGVAAIVASLLAFLRAGDHALIADTAYEPTRNLAQRFLSRYGMSATFYDPLIGAGIEKLIQPNTRLVFLESPGSLTFEVQDVPAIAAAARRAGAVVALDNTWGPSLFQPFAKGVDVSLQSGTKYINGHSDALIGFITTTEAVWPKLRHSVAELGACAGAEECYLAQRGVRTLAVRLKRHEETGLAIARWLAARPEVARVLHPALPTDPGHALWRRDFSGACGLFGVILKPARKEAVAAMLDGMSLFKMGFSWGGFESLILPTHPERARSAVPWRAEGPTLRLHAGLEDAGDLIADLDAGLARLRAAA